MMNTVTDITFVGVQGNNSKYSSTIKIYKMNKRPANELDAFFGPVNDIEKPRATGRRLKCLKSQ